MMLLFLSLYLSIVSSSASDSPKINCLVINLEYVNCSWNDHGIENHNYKFKSRFVNYPEIICPKYHKTNSVNIGCMFPYNETQRFNSLYTSLYYDNGSLVTMQKHQLKNEVKLNPPYNLSIEARDDTELWLYWNVTQDRKCIESRVRHRICNTTWQNKTPGTKNVFSLPFPSKKRYEFQVSCRIDSACGESKFWSEWSKPVYWGPLKPNNNTEDPVVMSVTSVVLYIVGATIMLVLLSCLLVHSERLRVILVPVVPNTGQNVSKYLAALFDNYDGNVEKWLSISKDLEKGFKPNFTERACHVREYRIVSQSSGDSGSVLSMPTDLSSDYQSMHSYSSASTIPGPADTSQNQNPPPADKPV